jgi:hypothetical protein
VLTFASSAVSARVKFRASPFLTRVSSTASCRENFITVILHPCALLHSFIGVKLELAMKVRVSVRKALEPLARWVAWVYEQNASAPEHVRHMSPERKRQVRELARGILEKIADAQALRLKAAKHKSSTKSASPVEIELPPLRTRIFISDGRLSVWSDVDPYRESLVPALEKEIERFGRNGPSKQLGNVTLFHVGWRVCAWTRLRQCGAADCHRPFVALTPKAVYCRKCSNREKQQRFYAAHAAQERKRKLAAYHALRLRLAAAQQRRVALRRAPK